MDRVPTLVRTRSARESTPERADEPGSASAELTPHGGRRLAEAYLATGANAFLEQAVWRRVGAHGTVEIGSLGMRASGSRRRLGAGGRRSGSNGEEGRARECVFVRWDPSNPHAATFAELLDVFWESHDPTHEPIDEEHASVIFYTSDEQKEVATKSLEDASKKFGLQVHTQLAAAYNFAFTPAPERFQRRLERAGDKSAYIEPPQLFAEPLKARPSKGSALAVVEFVLEWLKIFFVHLAARLLQGSARPVRP